MTEPTFALMAAAVHKLVGSKLIDFARQGQQFSPEHTERVHLKAALASAGADMLTELVPHERLVRALVGCGALVDFPAFSANTFDLKPGAIALIRAALEVVTEQSCQIRIDGQSTAQTMAWIRRRDIIGVEKRGGLVPIEG